MFTPLNGLCAVIILSLIILLAITRQEQQRQRARLATLHAALDGVELALIVLDANRQVRHLSPAFAALAGITPDTRTLAAFPEAWHNWIEAHCHLVLASGSSDPEERLLASRDETPALPLRLRGKLLEEPGDQPGVLLWCENLAAHNDAVNAVLEREYALRTRSQAFVQTLIDVIPRPVYARDGQGRYLLANKAFCASHGLEKHQVIGHTATELGMPESEESALEDARVMAGSPVFKEEYQPNPERPDDDRFTIVSKQSCLAPEGQRVLVATHMDISPWRIAERELHQALQREKDRRRRTQDFVQRLLDVFPHPICLKNAEGRYVMLN